MGSGTLTLTQREGANPSLSRTCAKVTCIYGAKEVKATLFDGLANAAHLAFEAVPLQLEEAVGGACAEEAFFTAHFTILSAAPVFVV
jgi:hypothetical protein